MMEKTEPSTNRETSPAGLRTKNRMSWSERAAEPDSETASRSSTPAAGVRTANTSTLTTRWIARKRVQFARNCRPMSAIVL
jgi:hypothetical protein